MSRLLLGGRAGWSLAVELLQLASSTLVFLILVTFMDQRAYGELTGILGLTLPALNVAAVGSHVLLLRRAAQGDDLASAWQRAVTIGLIGPVAMAALMIALQPLVLPRVDGLAYALFFIGNLPLFWINELAVFLGVGTGRLRRAAAARLILVVVRFGSLAWFAVWGDGSLLQWAWASAVGFGLSAVAVVVYVLRAYGLGLRFRLRREVMADVVEGVPYSANSATEGLVDSSDRWLLARFDHITDNALYGLGARIVQFGYVPLRTLLRAFDAELFAAGKWGIRSALAVTRRMVPPSLVVAAVVSVGLVVVAPLIPLVAGSEYEESIGVIRWLAFLPLVRMVQYLAGNTLTAAARQWWRTGATAVAVVVNLGLNLWLLPNGGWRTAIATTFVSEVLLALLLIGLMVTLARREPAPEGDGQRPGAPSER